MQLLWNPPGESQLFDNLVHHGVLSNVNWMQLLKVLECDPVGTAILPFDK
jgi:hypothetical protein